MPPISPTTLWHWLDWLALPFTLVFPQALLIRFAPELEQRGLDNGQNRAARGFIGILGISSCVRAMLTYRLEAPSWQAANYLIAFGMVHMVISYIINTLIDPASPQDAYVARGRPRLVSAIDWCINMRRTGLVESQPDGEPCGSAVPGAVSKNGCQGNHGSLVNAQKKSIRHIAYPVGVPINLLNLDRSTYPPRGRTRALVRHVVCAGMSYLVGHILVTSIRRFENWGSAIPTGDPQSWLVRLLRSSWVQQAVYTVHLPVFVTFAGDTIYHSVAIVTLASGFWEVESWELDLFDSPWLADSLRNFWGRRWHQVLRHDFIVLATVPLFVLGIETQRVSFGAMTLLCFAVSGLLHGLCACVCVPPAAFWPIANAFLYSGAGSVLELWIRSATGRRIAGVPGLIWTWVFLIVTAHGAMVTLRKDCGFDSLVAGYYPFGLSS